MSRQRTLVLDEFLSAKQQISVDELFIKLRTTHPTLGRTTVYRNLKLFAECGIARVILVDGTCRYEKLLPADFRLDGIDLLHIAPPTLKKGFFLQPLSGF